MTHETHYAEKEQPISLDELIKQETQREPIMLDHEQQQALKNLDERAVTDPIAQREIAYIVGVLSGVKPTCMILSSPEFHEELNSLGLATSILEKDDIDLVAVSFSEVLADKLRDAFEELHTDPDDQKTHRKIGKLLGYPETSTEYFIDRCSSIDNPTEEQMPMIRPAELINSPRNHFCNMILSKDHWREELDQYVIPMENAAKKMIPETYRLWVREARRQKVADGLRKLIGSKPNGDI